MELFAIRSASAAKVVFRRREKGCFISEGNPGVHHHEHGPLFQKEMITSAESIEERASPFAKPDHCKCAGKLVRSCYGARCCADPSVDLGNQSHTQRLGDQGEAAW
jgi:hypothetical protein